MSWQLVASYSTVKSTDIFTVCNLFEIDVHFCANVVFENKACLVLDFFYVNTYM